DCRPAKDDVLNQIHFQEINAPTAAREEVSRLDAIGHSASMLAVERSQFLRIKTEGQPKEIPFLPGPQLSRLRISHASPGPNPVCRAAAGLSDSLGGAPSSGLIPRPSACC